LFCPEITLVKCLGRIISVEIAASKTAKGVHKFLRLFENRKTTKGKLLRRFMINLVGHTRLGKTFTVSAADSVCRSKRFHVLVLINLLSTFNANSK